MSRWPDRTIVVAATGAGQPPLVRVGDRADRRGALIDGVRYTVPAVTGVRRGWRMVRPQVRPNELMVFTPYAIHGGGVNRNCDRTRVSLEIRFWRRR